MEKYHRLVVCSLIICTWLLISVGSFAIPSPTALAQVAEEDCTQSIASMISDAESGDVISVPACIYRETVTIDKPLALIADPGAEIRGSDVVEDWVFDSALNRWRSVVTVPNYYTRDTSKCADPSNRCNLPEQVFVNGEAYEQMAHESVPSGQQFALDSNRRVVLGDDPTGQMVEVTMRQAWVLADRAVDDVVIKGFTMKHVSQHAQGGGGISLDYDNHNWTIEDNKLSDSHADLLQLAGTGHEILSNELFNAGWVAINGDDSDCDSAGGSECDTGEVRGNLIQRNKIYNNTIGGFNPRWAGGGVKLIGNYDTILELNEVYDNVGPGLWCDIECRDIVFRDNCLYDNSSNGIFFEISSGAKIYGNRVFGNGFGYADWGWGSGILVSGASLDTGMSDAEIYDNVVAWNADGIGVVRPGSRGGAHEVTIPKNNLVRDNVIALDLVLNGDQRWAMGWLEDRRWNGEIWEAASNNLGRDNSYWIGSAHTTRSTFKYDATNFNATQIDLFNATLGAENDTILTDAQLQAILSSEDMPLTSTDPNFDCSTLITTPPLSAMEDAHPWQSEAPSPTWEDYAWDRAMGYHFTPETDGFVTALGGYFNGTKTVRLFNRATGEMLAETSVTASNNWGYTDISPIVVEESIQYTVAVYAAGSGASYVGQNVGISLPISSGGIRIDATTYIDTSADPDARPVNELRDRMYGQADIRFSTSIFEDDFETDKGWLVNPNGTDDANIATKGQWERGNPEETTANSRRLQNGTTTSGSFALVTCAVAGERASACDVDGGVTSIRSPQISLPATPKPIDLLLSYYLAHSSTSNSNDFLRLSWVSGGESSVLFSEKGSGEYDEAFWTRDRDFSLSSFAGETGYLLFEAADGSDLGGTVEAAIDDVRIIVRD